MSYVELRAFKNSTRPPKRHRGHTHGRYCGKGMKGEKARAGRTHISILEGGQMPLVRRLPKRGFSNRKFEHKLNIVNLSSIEKNYEASEKVTAETLKNKGMIKGAFPVKILGNGELTKAVEADVYSASASAVEKIKKAGGSITLKSEADKKNAARNKEAGKDKSSK